MPTGHDDSSVADAVPVINALTQADVRGGRRADLTLAQLIRLNFFISGRIMADWGVQGTIPLSAVVRRAISPVIQPLKWDRIDA